MMPDFFETEINTMEYFTFLLTGTALGVESDFILEISVDYGVALDGSQITANAWARERNGVIKGFLQTVHVALGEDAPIRIVEALNCDDLFLSNSVRFIAMLQQQQRGNAN